MRLAWPFDNPNYLGCSVAFAAPFLIVGIASLKGRIAGWKQFFGYAMIVVVAGILAGTESRGAWAGSAVSCALLVIREQRHAQLVSLFVMATGIFAGVYGDGLHRAAQVAHPYLDGSITSRFHIWGVALSLISDNPSGIGRGLFPVLYADFIRPEGMTSGYETAVNDYITIALEHGIVVFGVVMMVLWFALSLELSAPRERMGPIRIALFGGFVAFLVSAFFNTFQRETILMVAVLLCLIAMLVIAWRITPSWVILRQAVISIAFGMVTALAAFELSRWMSVRSPQSLLVQKTTSALVVTVQKRAFTTPPPRMVVYGASSGYLDKVDSVLMRSLVDHGYRVVAIRPISILSPTPEVEKTCGSLLQDAIPSAYIGIGREGYRYLIDYPPLSHVSVVLIRPDFFSLSDAFRLPNQPMLVIGANPVIDQDQFIVRKLMDKNRNIASISPQSNSDSVNAVVHFSSH